MEILFTLTAINNIVCDILLNYLKVYDKIACDIEHL